jgi:hypothetical protein
MRRLFALLIALCLLAPLQAQAAAPRVDNGPPYDATEVRSRPGTPADLTCRPTPLEVSRLHEIPLYHQVNEAAGWCLSMHGPQDPFFVGGSVGKPLADHGANPNTGLPRANPYTHKPPVPFIHTMIWELHDNGTIYRYVGGVRIHQVAMPGGGDIWYVKLWCSALAATGCSGAYVGKHFEMVGKLIFAETAIVQDAAGLDYPLTSITGSLAGGPSFLTIKDNGSGFYPKGLRRTLIVTDARINAEVWWEYPHNRYGFPTVAPEDIVSAVPQEGRDPLYGEYGIGDDLADADDPRHTH